MHWATSRHCDNAAHGPGNLHWVDATSGGQPPNEVPDPWIGQAGGPHLMVPNSICSGANCPFHTATQRQRIIRSRATAHEHIGRQSRHTISSLTRPTDAATSFFPLRRPQTHAEGLYIGRRANVGVPVVTGRRTDVADVGGGFEVGHTLEPRSYIGLSFLRMACRCCRRQACGLREVAHAHAEPWAWHTIRY